MRLGGIGSAVFGALLSAMLFSAPAKAQDWFEYVNQENHFAVSLPTEPSQSAGTFQSASGATLPAAIFTATHGESTYTATVVDYSSLGEEEYLGALEHAAAQIRARGGEVTSENDASYEGFDTWMMQLTNPDGTRSFMAIALPPVVSRLERLYIIEGRSPEGVPPPGLFQQSLSFRDDHGDRMRYDTDVDGNKFRIIGDTCGFPYTRRGEEGLVICDY
jgi:hypothetical protein